MKKFCNECKRKKDISEFNKRNDRSIGIRSRCRECLKKQSKIRIKKWVEKNSGNCPICGRKLANYKAKLCRKCKDKNSLGYWANKQRPRGELSVNWKGGITPENRKIRASIEYKLWRKVVYERDNFTCQKTGQKGGELVVHHINNFADFPELRLAIDNGITLFKKAHQKFHKIYGNKNNTKEQLNEFLNVETSIKIGNKNN